MVALGLTKTDLTTNRKREIKMKKIVKRIIIDVIKNSKMEFIPIDIRPYYAFDFVVIDKYELIKILSSKLSDKDWKYDFVESWGGGLSVKTLFLESTRPIYKNQKAIEIHLPKDEIQLCKRTLKLLKSR